MGPKAKVVLDEFSCKSFVVLALWPEFYLAIWECPHQLYSCEMFAECCRVLKQLEPPRYPKTKKTHAFFSTQYTMTNMHRISQVDKRLWVLQVPISNLWTFGWQMVKVCWSVVLLINHLTILVHTVRLKKLRRLGLSCWYRPRHWQRICMLVVDFF